MGTYRIKNWERFQHYRDRRPPWIKFYTEIIEEFDEAGNVNDLFALSDSAKLTLVLAWALASHFGGHLPDKDEKWFAHRLGIRSINLKELIDKGFIIASDYASMDASDLATEVLSPEGELQRELQGYKTTLERQRGSTTTLVRARARFVPPTVEEVQAYLNEINERRFTAQAFVDHYQQQGWKLGNGRTMSDWKASVRTWRHKRDEEKKAEGPKRGRGGMIVP